MKIKWYACMILSLFIQVTAVAAEMPKRTAVITDTAGVTTEVTGLRVYQDRSRYCLDWASGDALVVKKGVLQMAIPLNNLIEAKQTGKTVVMTYLWRGKQLTVEGILVPHDMKGKSVFGDFQMKTDRIGTLRFKEPPLKKMKSKQKKVMIRASLKLGNNATIPVIGLKRFARYYSTAGYVVGGSNRSQSSTNIPFLRGESKATVKMEDITRVDFGSGDAVTIVLKSGTTGSGKLGSASDGINGFCGQCDTGHLYIERKEVKTIDFSKEQPQSK